MNAINHIQNFTYLTKQFQSKHVFYGFFFHHSHVIKYVFIFPDAASVGYGCVLCAAHDEYVYVNV